MLTLSRVADYHLLPHLVDQDPLWIKIVVLNREDYLLLEQTARRDLAVFASADHDNVLLANNDLNIDNVFFVLPVEINRVLVSIKKLLDSIDCDKALPAACNKKFFVMANSKFKCTSVDQWLNWTQHDLLQILRANEPQVGVIACNH